MIRFHFVNEMSLMILHFRMSKILTSCDEDKAVLLRCGSRINVFQVARGQRGHGLGSALIELFRSCLSKIESSVNVHHRPVSMWQTDVVEGTLFRDAFQKHLPNGIRGFRDAQFGISGSGNQRKRTYPNKPVKRFKQYIQRIKWHLFNHNLASIFEAN